MDRQVYKCECGYTTHFEKALEAHCRFRHHHPAVKEVKEVVKPAKRTKKAVAVPQPEQTEKKTRKPRAKKTAAKEQE